MWHERGAFLMSNRRYEEALECFDQAVVTDPRYVSAWMMRTSVLWALERWDPALESIDHVLALDPR